MAIRTELRILTTAEQQDLYSPPIFSEDEQRFSLHLMKPSGYQFDVVKIDAPVYANTIAWILFEANRSYYNLDFTQLNMISGLLPPILSLASHFGHLHCRIVSCGESMSVFWRQQDISDGPMEPIGLLSKKYWLKRLATGHIHDTCSTA